MADRDTSSPKITLKLTATVTNTLDDASIVSCSHPNATYSPSLSAGVDEGQANRGWQSIGRTITNGHQEVIDIADFLGLDIGAGAGNDALGQALHLEEIVAILITNDNDNTAAGVLEVYPSASEGWTPIGTHTVAVGGAIHGQGCLFKSDPSAVAFIITATNHRITLVANGGDVEYSIYLIGRSEVEASSSSSSSSSSASSASSQSSSQSSLSSVSSVSSVSSSSSSSGSSVSSQSSSVSSQSWSSHSSQSSSYSSSSQSSHSQSSASPSSQSSSSSFVSSRSSVSSQSSSSSSVSSISVSSQSSSSSSKSSMSSLSSISTSSSSSSPSSLSSSSKSSQSSSASSSQSSSSSSESSSSLSSRSSQSSSSSSVISSNT